MSELCREVFEKHQAKLLNINYQELKDQFDRHEKCFRKRYAAFSDFEKEFDLWQAAWNVRQTEIDQLKAQIIDQGQRFNDQNQKNADLEYKYLQVQKRIDEGLSILKGFWAKDNDPDFVIVVDAEKALRGEHE